MGAAMASLRTTSGHRDILTRPTISANFLTRQTNCGDQIVDRLEREGGQVQLRTNKLNHTLVRRAIRVDITRHIDILAFMAANITARNEVVFITRPREIDETTRIKKRRTGNPHVHFAAAFLIQAVSLLAELRAAND